MGVLCHHQRQRLLLAFYLAILGTALILMVASDPKTAA